MKITSSVNGLSFVLSAEPEVFAHELHTLLETLSRYDGIKENAVIIPAKCTDAINREFNLETSILMNRPMKLCDCGRFAIFTSPHIEDNKFYFSYVGNEISYDAYVPYLFSSTDSKETAVQAMIDWKYNPEEIEDRVNEKAFTEHEKELLDKTKF